MLDAFVANPMQIERDRLVAAFEANGRGQHALYEELCWALARKNWREMEADAPAKLQSPSADEYALCMGGVYSSEAEHLRSAPFLSGSIDGELSDDEIAAKAIAVAAAGNAPSAIVRLEGDGRFHIARVYPDDRRAPCSYVLMSGALG